MDKLKQNSFCYICNQWVNKAEHECEVAKELIAHPTHIHWTASDSITDPFRKAYLSEKSRIKTLEQGRRADPLAPRDKSEVAVIEAATGRRYIGNNFEGIDVPKEDREKYGD